jgi:DNA-3-methyladenine glycosylase II
MPKSEFYIVPPFDFQLSIKFCERTRFDKINRDRRYRLKLLTQIDREPVFIEIGCAGTIENPVGLARWSFPDKGRIKKDKILMLARKILSADVNLVPFYERLSHSEKLRELSSDLRGLKLILTPTPFESAAWAIIGQQVNLTFAHKVKIEMEKKYGRNFLIDGSEYYLFPEYGKIARARIDSLRKMQFSQRKAEYIIELAKRLVKQENFLETLADLPYNRVIEKLLAVRGIGIWSANYLLMRGVGHLDCLPLGDTGLTRAIKERFGLNQKPDKDKVEKLAEEFKPYRSLFTLYLWYSL